MLKLNKHPPLVQCHSTAAIVLWLVHTCNTSRVDPPTMFHHLNHESALPCVVHMLHDSRNSVYAVHPTTTFHVSEVYAIPQHCPHIIYQLLENCNMYIRRSHIPLIHQIVHIIVQSCLRLMGYLNRNYLKSPVILATLLFCEHKKLTKHSNGRCVNMRMYRNRPTHVISSALSSDLTMFAKC
jgi:hypothetical protein